MGIIGGRPAGSRSAADLETVPEVEDAIPRIAPLEVGGDPLVVAAVEDRLHERAA
jgi:hypothetical protein